MADVANPQDVSSGDFQGGGILSSVASIVNSAATAYQANLAADQGIYRVGNQTYVTGAATLNWSYVILGLIAVSILMIKK